MVAVALLLPFLMLCAVLALGRYEERVLGAPEPARPERRLRAVPDLTPQPAPAPSPPSSPDRALPARESLGDDRRDVA